MASVAAATGWERAIEPGRSDGRLVAEAAEAPRSAENVGIPSSLAADLATALRRSGVESLYSHQLEALEAAAEGNVIATSGTASGKSLSFNLPVLDGLVRDDGRRALYLYPTKALAQDQARKLSELGLERLRHAIYDGDTPREDRPAIRRRSNLILTNPDMLHVGILPHHKNWGDFFASLDWVVVDEAHTYRGVFGSHVANVLRRLRRVARRYGAEPRFVLTSATIANPVELAERLVGQRFRLVDGDGAPRAGRRIGMWNPPVIDPRSMTRRSVLSEAAELLADLVGEGVRTICFLRSRRGIELIQRFTRMRLEELGRPELANRIAPYRAGYTPQQRREIEARLAAGDLLAVVATDALDLARGAGPPRAGESHRALSRRLHAAAAPRDRGPPCGRRPAGGGGDGRPRAGHRHRLPGRRDLRHVSRHRGEPAPDVGPCGKADRGGGPLHRRRGRAGSVLLPAPRGVPRATGRGRDPRSRERAHPGCAPARRRLRDPALRCRLGAVRRALARASGDAGRAR